MWNMHGYPFLDSVNVAIANRTIPVRVSGSGLPILLLHGYPLDSRMWDRVVPILSLEHLCIAPDLRGFGRSVEETKSFSIETLAKDCIQLLDAMQVRQRVVVCGLSMGGYVAMQIAQRVPERLRALVLTNTRANADDLAAAVARRSVASSALTQGVEKAVLPMLGKLLSQRTTVDQPEVVDLVRTMMLETRASTIAWAQLAMASREDFRHRMQDWTIPAVCIAGAEDSITPPEVLQRMAEVIPNAKFHIVANSAHLTPLDSPEEFANLVVESIPSRP